jgi:hypothetical protein
MEKAGRRFVRRPAFSCVPGMGWSLEVQVLWEVGRNNPSERQGEETNHP